MHFNQALHYLLDLGHETLAIKLGLQNIELLLAALQRPETSFPSVQIAGTNGKGSTAVVLDSICRAAGIKTGLYTSPHLVSITERIRIAGLEISENAFARQATIVREAAEALLAEGKIAALPTFFEQVTAIALAEFRDARVDLAILETGLGGRLDAATAANAEIVGITPISLDHQQYLGETIEEIAAEKAAIISPGVIAVISQQSPGALDVILRRCKEVGVKPDLSERKFEIKELMPDGKMLVSFDTEHHRYEGIPVGLRGVHQLENVLTAIRLAEALRERGFDISESAIRTGVEDTRHPGRLEFWPGRPAFLFDGAHNPAGADSLREYLDSLVTQPITLVFGAMTDKNFGALAETLFPAAQRVVLTKPDNPRAASLVELRNVAEKSFAAQQIHGADSVGEALKIAQRITPPDGLICITGSLYLVGEAQSILNHSKLARIGRNNGRTTTSSRG